MPIVVTKEQERHYACKRMKNAIDYLKESIEEPDDKELEIYTRATSLIEEAAKLGCTDTSFTTYDGVKNMYLKKMLRLNGFSFSEKKQGDQVIISINWLL